MRALFALALCLAAAPAYAEAPDAGAAEAAPPPGQAIYERRCAGCHGDDGKGDTRVGRKYDIADFTDRKWAKGWSKAQVMKTVREGVKDQMPAWGEKLSKDEIAAVAEYVFRLAGAPNHK